MSNTNITTTTNQSKLNKKKKKILILLGDGLNCEGELRRAFINASLSLKYKTPVEISITSMTTSTFLKAPEQLLTFDILAIPGGFSFGDGMRSGKILAEKLRPSFSKNLSTFILQGGLVLGICNGFQVLMQLGVFEKQQLSPQNNEKKMKRTLTLTTNDHGQFRNEWVVCEVTDWGRKTPWLKNIEAPLSLPIRHKEGRILLAQQTNLNEELFKNQMALTYTRDVNGSLFRAAGITDHSGQILGLMPHPEVAIEEPLRPLLKKDQTQSSDKFADDLSGESSGDTCLAIFKNALQF